MKLFNIVKLNDMHVPFEDKEVVKVAFDFCKRLQPDIIVTDEWHDFYPLSRFSKDPTRLNDLQIELDMVEEYYGKLRKACPESRILMLDSNHLKRMKKYIRTKAQELACLRNLDMENLLDLGKHNIEYMDVFSCRGYLFKHGNRINKHSAYTAKNELEEEGVPGASGHSHRLGQHYKRKRGGRYTWIECGCLCDLNPEYMEGKIADWHHGLGLVQFKGNSRHFMAHTISITDNEIIWGFA